MSTPCSVRRSLRKEGIALAAFLAVLASLPTAVLGASGMAQDNKSKNPPVGAPWVRSFPEARAQALQSGKPIFLYSTKTY